MPSKPRVRTARTNNVGLGDIDRHAHLASVHQKLGDSVLARAGQTRDGADRLAFAEKMDDAGAVGGRELVHALFYNDPYA